MEFTAILNLYIYAVQAAGLAARLALTGFQPDLVLSSPATRCLQTAALVFPHEFAPPPSPSSPQPQRQRHHAAASPATSPNPASLPPAVSRAIPAAAAVSPPAVAPPATASPKRLACALKVSPLLPETVDSWSDVDQPLAAVVAASLEPFQRAVGQKWTPWWWRCRCEPLPSH